MRQAIGAPEPRLPGVIAGPVAFQMRRQHIGETAHLAPAHGVGLPRKREWPCAHFADAPASQMAMNDGVDLVRTLRRLVDALAPGCDHALRADPRIAERRDQ